MCYVNDVEKSSVTCASLFLFAHLVIIMMFTLLSSDMNKFNLQISLKLFLSLYE